MELEQVTTMGAGAGYIFVTCIHTYTRLYTHLYTLVCAGAHTHVYTRVYTHI